ncbi:hypothetical protein LP414_03265 [Polaromonas sp. P1(28)-13]|nr:hypothetical protein LP414_03265 [Polaromonas sp. P1(28)-13]
MAEQKTFARNNIALIAPLQGDRSVVGAGNVFPLRSGYVDEVAALLKEMKAGQGPHIHCEYGELFWSFGRGYCQPARG